MQNKQTKPDLKKDFAMGAAYGFAGAIIPAAYMHGFTKLFPADAAAPLLQQSFFAASMSFAAFLPVALVTGNAALQYINKRYANDASARRTVKSGAFTSAAATVAISLTLAIQGLIAGTIEKASQRQDFKKSVAEQSEHSLTDNQHVNFTRKMNVITPIQSLPLS